jgi:processing peptidase subunit alpha
MLREAPRQLLPLVAAGRAYTTSQAAASYAPAIASKSSGGVLSFITGGSRLDVPLNEPLQLVGDVKPNSPPAERPKLAVSEHHGVKVAAQDSAGPLASVAVYVNAGSANETAGTSGASKYLEYLGFKTTANRTTFRLTRELEKMGASASVQAGREATGFQVTTTKMALPEAVEVLLDSVCNARLSGWEVEDMLAKVQEDAAHALANPEVLVSEILHRWVAARALATAAAAAGPGWQPCGAAARCPSADADARRAACPAAGPRTRAAWASR